MMQYIIGTRWVLHKWRTAGKEDLLTNLAKLFGTEERHGYR